MKIKKISYAILFILPIFAMDSDSDKTPKKSIRKNALINYNDSDKTPKKNDHSRSRTPIKEDQKNDSSDSEKTPKKTSSNKIKASLKNDPNRTPEKPVFPIFIDPKTEKPYVFQFKTGPNNETPQKKSLMLSPSKNDTKYPGLGYK